MPWSPRLRYARFALSEAFVWALGSLISPNFDRNPPSAEGKGSYRPILTREDGRARVPRRGNCGEGVGGVRACARRLWQNEYARGRVPGWRVWVRSWEDFEGFSRQCRLLATGASGFCWVLGGEKALSMVAHLANRAICGCRFMGGVMVVLGSVWSHAKGSLVAVNRVADNVYYTVREVGESR